MTHRAPFDAIRRQIDELATAERQFLETAPYRLVHEHDMRGARYLVRAHVTRPAPAEIDVAIARLIHDLHSSLDDLASRLAGAPAKFPIFESLPLFAQRARKSLSRMPDDAQAEIEALQPYHAIGGYRNGPLWTLQQLELHAPARAVTGAIRDGATMGVNTRRKVELLGEPSIATGPFDDGAIVASVQTKIVGPDPKLDLFFRTEYALAFPRREPARGAEVVALLGDLCDHLETVVFPPLERSLPTA